MPASARKLERRTLEEVPTRPAVLERVSDLVGLGMGDGRKIASEEAINKFLFLLFFSYSTLLLGGS